MRPGASAAAGPTPGHKGSVTRESKSENVEAALIWAQLAYTKKSLTKQNSSIYELSTNFQNKALEYLCFWNFNKPHLWAGGGHSPQLCL